MGRIEAQVVGELGPALATPWEGARIGCESTQSRDDSVSEPARPPLHLVPREELPFEELVDDFVDRFRRLTREWHGV